MVDIIINTKSESETEALGEALASKLFRGAFIALSGNLGAGKTAFARGVGRGLLCPSVKSPTFAIVQTHKGRLTLHHFDVYRLGGASELYDIGFSEYIDGDAVVLMEWPENAKDALPASRMDIYVTALNADERSFRFEPRDEKHAALITGLEEDWIRESAKGG